MGNSLRCCLACVLPCGALDLIRIVHLNGCVEEITGPITAGEVLKANPNHVLSKPTDQGVVRRILILSPETELKRGTIYFLIPSSPLPEKKKQGNKTASSSKMSKQCTVGDDAHDSSSSQCNRVVSGEKKPSSRDRRHSRSGVWQPYLKSISED
ncbi:uncharacterized protein LOC129304138 [Prosopis cineraria]|uniref:uncharacterized protein LOC129304138 n=1 Tax=Prosopis cineraria TaxID=364024 RepID=UPI00240F120A|nr:uncharacterized protein LOC129304138 [Prosopis cineraria]